MPVAPGRVNAPPSPSSPSSPASLVFRNRFGSSAALPSGAAQRCRRREGREDAESERAPVPMPGKLSQPERRRRQKLLASAQPDLCQTVLREGPDPPPPSAVVVSPATRRALKLPVETHGTLTVRQQACPCGCGATGRSIIVEGYAEGTILEVDDGHGLPPTRLVTQSGRLRVDDFRVGGEEEEGQPAVWVIDDGKKSASLRVFPAEVDSTEGRRESSHGSSPESNGAYRAQVRTVSPAGMVRLMFDNGLTLMIPGNWKLQAAERPGSGTSAHGRRCAVSQPVKTDLDEVKGRGPLAPNPTVDIDQTGVEAEIAELNRRARQEKAERRSAGGGGQAERPGEGRRSASHGLCKGQSSLRQRPPDHEEESLLEDPRSPRQKQKKGRVRSGQATSKAGDGCELHDEDLWKRHPRLFALEDPPPACSEEESNSKARQIPRKRKNKKKRTVIDLDELIAADFIIRGGNRQAATASDGGTPGGL